MAELKRLFAPHHDAPDEGRKKLNPLSGGSEPQGVPLAVDLEQELKLAFDEVIERWQKRRREGTWASRQDHLKDMLRRVLVRATTTAPGDYDTVFTKQGVPYHEISRAEEIVRQATELVDNLSTREPTDQERAEGRDAILVTWRGARDPIGAIRDGHLRTQWVSAIRGALSKKWRFKHYVLLESTDEENQEKALRCVLNVLAFTGGSDRYEPMLLAADAQWPASPDPITDYLVVPNRGILELHGAEEAYYYRKDVIGNPRLTELIEEKFEQLRGRVRDIAKTSTPLRTLYPQLSTKRREILRDMEAATGNRILCMDGLPQSLMPKNVRTERYEALRRRIQASGKPQEEVARLLTEAKEIFDSRGQREEQLRGQLDETHYWHRDICPKRAIERLVLHGRTSHKDVDDSFARLALLELGVEDFPSLTLPQRREFLVELVRRLRKYERYQLVLLEKPDDDIFGTYCLIREKVGVLLQFWKRKHDPTDMRPREYTAIHIDNPIVVHAFASNPLLQPYGGELDPQRKVDTIAYLEKQIATLDHKVASHPK